MLKTTGFVMESLPDYITNLRFLYSFCLWWKLLNYYSLVARFFFVLLYTICHLFKQIVEPQKNVNNAAIAFIEHMSSSQTFFQTIGLKIVSNWAKTSAFLSQAKIATTNERKNVVLLKTRTFAACCSHFFRLAYAIWTEAWTKCVCVWKRHRFSVWL